MFYFVVVIVFALGFLFGLVSDFDRQYNRFWAGRRYAETPFPRFAIARGRDVRL